MSEGVEIIYDGQCPFCARYAVLVRLREAVGPVTLIDARSGDPRVAEVQAAGHDLDAGMVVRHAGRDYHGAEAMRLLALLSRRGPVGAAMRLLMSRPAGARRAYRLLALGRRAALRLLGRPGLSAERPGE